LKFNFYASENTCYLHYILNFETNIFDTHILVIDFAFHFETEI